MIGDEPGNTNKDPDASEEAVPESEGRAELPFLPAVHAVPSGTIWNHDQRIARNLSIPFKIREHPSRDGLRVSDESRFWSRLQAVIGLTGGETENPNVSSSLAGFVCSPLPRREQTWLPTKPASQPHGSPAVSSGMHLVNAPERPFAASHGLLRL